MDLIRTISCKLVVEPDRAGHLIDTMDAFADACNFIAAYGREHGVYRQFSLHGAIYADVRARFGLSANLAVRAIARVAPRLAKAKTRHSVFKPTSVDYDVRIFCFREEDWVVSLRLLDKRERFALDIGDWQRSALCGATPTSAVVCRKGSEFYIHIQIKESMPKPDEPTGVLGVDLGLKDIAMLSDGTPFGGEALNAYRLKRHRVRKSLQANAHTGSRTRRKNARRTLKRLTGKERRYQRDINHRISKHIVETAKKNKHAIALEDLSGIRDRTNKRLRKSQRGLHNSWAFYQLQDFVKYKAARAGIKVVSIDPRYTSQTCSSCHHLGDRRGKVFSCSNCGGEMDADQNGALNIAAVGASVIMPENSTPFATTFVADVG